MICQNSEIKIKIVVIESLQIEINNSDDRTKKLFEKQKKFMELKPDYPSLGRKKLNNVADKYGNSLWEIRLDGKRRIIFVQREQIIIWLKFCNHDELTRKNTITVHDEY